MKPIDPVCIFHGKKRSEHECLYCALCFNADLKIQDYHVQRDGTIENVCNDCYIGELEMLPHYIKKIFKPLGDLSEYQADGPSWNELAAAIVRLREVADNYERHV